VHGEQKSTKSRICSIPRCRDIPMFLGEISPRSTSTSRATKQTKHSFTRKVK
jgi:hypothetical protein